MIPASELREGYTLVLPDGSSQVIASSPTVVVVVRLQHGNDIAYYSPDHMVAVEAEASEF